MKTVHLAATLATIAAPTLAVVLNPAGCPPAVFGANIRPNQRKRRLQARRLGRFPVRQRK